VTVAARGKKLSDAYLELRADDSKLSGDVKVKATRAAKGFGAQLNNALKALDIDPIDVKADPKTALAAIETTRERLRVMSRDAESVEVRVRTERALGQVEKFRRQLGEVDDKPVKIEADPSPARRQVEQLQKRLASLGIDPPVQIDADPKAALAAVGRVDAELENLSKSADSVQVRIDATSARSDLARLKQQITDVGDDAAEGFGARFVGRVGPLIASAPLSPPMLAAVGAAGAAAAPLLSGIIASAIIGGAGAGGMVGGAILAARDQRVQAAGRELGAFLLADLERRADRFVDPMLDGIEDVRAGWLSLDPELDRIFASSRFVDPLVAGLLAGGRHLIGGLADAVDKADPVIAAFGASLERVGDATGDTFGLLADDADAAASAVNDLTVGVANFIRVTGGIVHAGAAVKRWADEVDVAIDRGRYWMEDWISSGGVMEHFGWQLDLTADGFRAGSKEAEAFRKATLGTADASDFATLKAAGMTDAQIAAADASGTFRAKTAEVARALGMSADALVATETEVKQLQAELEATGVRMEMFGDIGTAAFDGLLLSTGAVTGAMLRQKTTADQLRHAYEQMYGAVIGQTEANEGYEASWDQLSETVKGNSDQIGRNANSLDIHTKAGRSNRDALQELLTKSNEMYYADIEAGVAVDEARKKHEARTAAIRTEAGQLKLNKTETEKLIGTYGNIPPKKTTDLLLEGVDRIVASLTDLYIFQRSLAEGITLGQAKAAVTGTYGVDPKILKRTGGEITGQGLRGVDSEVIIAAPGEFMQPVPAVDYYGVAAMEAIRHRQIPKEALQGFRTGGLIGAPWSRRMRYETDVRGTHVPTRDEVARKVVAVPPVAGPTLDFMVRAVRAAFPALDLISGYRPGSMTLTGNPSYHGMRRAVDYPPDREMAAWVNRNYMARTREFISPFQEYNILNGRRHRYTGAVWNQHNWSGGNAHNHWAMDNGGYLMPGWNPPIYNGTGRPEPVTPAPIMDQVVDRLERLIDAVDRVAPGVGRELNGQVTGLRQLGRTWPASV
jgi:hypothetical protein